MGGFVVNWYYFCWLLLKLLAAFDKIHRVLAVQPDSLQIAEK